MSPQRSGEHDELAATLLAALGSDPVRPAIGSYRASSRLVWRTRGHCSSVHSPSPAVCELRGSSAAEACVIAPVG